MSNCPFWFSCFIRRYPGKNPCFLGAIGLISPMILARRRAGIVLENMILWQ